MKLRNKKTGEINLGDLHLDDFNSLAELNAEWEDYEEPKEYWYIDCDGEVYSIKLIGYNSNKLKEIGNYFETKEEAEKAVEKLKAWKRLKDKGFRFNGVYDDYTIKFTAPNEEIGWFWCNGMDKDLDLLFGGK